MAREKTGFWVESAAGLLRLLTRMLGKRVFEGSDRIPREGPALLVFNHVSYLDPIYDGVFVYKAGRVPRFMAKNTLWNVPLVGAVLTGIGQIPVSRGSAEARDSLSLAHRALREGKIVAIYPEGTITRDPDGWPMYSRVGVAKLALENDVPVIPIVRWGTKAVYDHYGKRFRPFPRKRIVVRANEPIDLSAYRGREPSSGLLREVTDVIMGRVRELLADLRGEQPPTTFFVPKRASAPGRAAAAAQTVSGGAKDGENDLGNQQKPDSDEAAFGEESGR